MIDTPGGAGEATKERWLAPWLINLPANSFQFDGCVSAMRRAVRKVCPEATFRTER